MDEAEEFGNQMGEAYVKMERIRDLNVMIMVSFCWPQVVPASALRMLMRGEALFMMEVM